MFTLFQDDWFLRPLCLTGGSRLAELDALALGLGGEHKGEAGLRWGDFFPLFLAFKGGNLAGAGSFRLADKRV